MFKQIAAVACALALTACASTQTASTESPSPGADRLAETMPIKSTRATLHVKGMSCPLCAESITKNLDSMPGVHVVGLDLGSGEVEVTFEQAPYPSPAALAKTVTDSGFTVTGIETN